ncbi:hypothetical protein KKA53_03955 [Candidatus Dependentiae bacterium]|nr:hypothetical protein [Candidatus Dependentiae bacterium]
MKRFFERFLFISLVILIGLTTLIRPALTQEPPVDFDKFLEELFGPPPTKKSEPVPTKKTPLPSKKKELVEKKQLTAKQAENEHRTVLKLNEASRLLGELIPITKNDLFSPEIQAKIHKEIYKKVKDVQTKPTGIIEDKLLEDEFLEKAIDKKVPYQEQGVYGLEALIKEILSEDIYIAALATKNKLLKKITNFTTKLSVLNKNSNQFLKDIAQVKPTEQEQLTQLLLPLNQRKEPISLVRIEKKKVFDKEIKRQFKGQKGIQNQLKTLHEQKNSLEKQLLDLFTKQIQDFTKQLETIINDPEVKKKIEKVIKTAEELARTANRESRSQYSRSYGGGREPGDYQPRRQWDGNGDRDNWRPSYGQAPQYGEQYEKKDLPEETATTEEAKKDDTSWPPKKDTEEKKEKKSDLIMLMNKAVELVKDICSQIKGTTTIDDDILRTILENNHYKIKELNDIVTQVETRKNSPQAKNDQKKDEWKPAKRAYEQTFQQYIEPLVLLGKYGNVTITEKPNGRYAIDVKKQTQNIIRAIYKQIAFPKELEDRIKEKITETIQKNLVANMAGLKTFNPNTHLISLGIDKTLEPIRMHLFKTAQMLVAAKNNPISIDVATSNLNITNAHLDLIKQLENFANGKFSSFLQKQIFEVQKHTTETENHFNELSREIENIIEKQKITGTSKQAILKTFAYQGTTPTRGAPQLRELFNKTVSIGGKNYQYQEIAQYHLSASALNELDQCIQLINEIKNETRGKWNLRQPATPAIKILDAILAREFDVQADRVRSIQSAQTANVLTIPLQTYVANNPGITDAERLFSQYYEVELRRQYTLFVHCELKINNKTKIKSFIYRPTGARRVTYD